MTAHRVLFLCTGNSARSIMAEVILSHAGKGRFQAYSAGSYPSGRVNPLAMQTLQELGLPTDGLRSKSWDEFAREGAPRMDIILTVCDNAAAEACPVWPGRPATAHWGLADPAAVEGTDERKLAAFHEAAMILRRRVDLLVALPMEQPHSRSVRDMLNEIGGR